MAFAQSQILVPDRSVGSTLQLLAVGVPGHSDCRHSCAGGLSG